MARGNLMDGYWKKNNDKAEISTENNSNKQGNVNEENKIVSKFLNETLSEVYKDSVSEIIVIGKFLVNGEVVMEGTVPFEKFCTICEISKNNFFRYDPPGYNRDIINILNFVKQYVNKKITDDKRTMKIGGGLITAIYGKYSIVFNAQNQQFYINIVIPDRNKAIKFRENQLPKNTDIPYGVFFWIWINEDEMVCRDRAGDYFDRY